MNDTNVSRRGFFGRLTTAFAWLTARKAAPSERRDELGASTTSYRYDDLGRLLSVTVDLTTESQRTQRGKSFYPRCSL